MDFISRYKVVRRVLIVWALWITTEVSFLLFEGEVSNGKAAAYATFIGLVGTVFGMYVHNRHKEDKDAPS